METFESLPGAFRIFIGCIFVSAIWGCSNPFLRKGSAGPSVDVLYYKSGILSSLEVALRVLLDYRFSVPFLINQCGSIANNILLGAAPISLVSPITNALTFLFTALTASFLGEKINFTLKKAFGIVCILAGFALCLYGSDVS